MIEKMDDLIRLLYDASDTFRKWDLPAFRAPHVLDTVRGMSREAIEALLKNAASAGLRDLGGSAALIVSLVLSTAARIGGVRAVDRKLDSRSGARRRFLRSLGLASSGVAALLGIGKLAAIASETQEETPPIPRRALGHMGFNASILGMGGSCLPRGSTEAIAALLEAAFEAGINYFDTASQYGRGESERRIGLWLEALEAEGRRDEVFISTKTLSRGYRQASEEIENSLARLRTDHIDLLQVHAVNDEDIWRSVTARNGSLVAIEAAKEDGRVKHIGITGHRNPEILLRALDEYPFESVLCPLGVTDRLNVPFVERLLPTLVERGLSVVAMKVYAEGELPEVEADLESCLHYTLSLPISTAIVGMSSVTELVQNVAWTHSYLGITEDQIEALGQQVSEQVDVEEFWWKK